ncbi:hypothetical protein Ahy_A07g032004 [Arachis hypogaea]|uniref:Transposase MuDR plant domain-containing protein n=1 Tax=Arachis hypogaea TaxID=3818 RepID=A0A445C5U8_ARAHY|nr:hypothetical protein Ahy_A07g032004 [Arachis hypogaea]
MGQDHRRLDSKVIAQHIFTMVKADPTISIREVENHFGYKASYKNIWLAKQRVIAEIYSDWEESYNELLRWLFAMQMYLPGKIYFKFGYSLSNNFDVYNKLTENVTIIRLIDLEQVDGGWAGPLAQPQPPPSASHPDQITLCAPTAGTKSYMGGLDVGLYDGVYADDSRTEHPTTHANHQAAARTTRFA